MSMHQYVERYTGQVCTEKLFADPLVRFLYAPIRENAPQLFRLLTGRYSSRLLALLNYDWALGRRLSSNSRFLESCGINLEECVAPERLDTARKEQSRVTSEARGLAEQEVARAREGLAQALESARADLRSQAEDLAREAATRVLGRSIS